METGIILEKNHLPIINIKQLTGLFAELLLWYDKQYCKNIEGANEIVGEYLISKHEKKEY